jgi:hypothetical protein
MRQASLNKAQYRRSLFEILKGENKNRFKTDHTVFVVVMTGPRSVQIVLPTSVVIVMPNMTDLGPGYLFLYPHSLY